MRPLLVICFTAFAVLGFSGSATCEDAVTVSTDAQQQAKTAPKEPAFKDKSFVGSNDWQGEGRIIESKADKRNLSSGDVVYTDLGSDKVKEGSLCDIFRKGDPVKDPSTGRNIGYEIRHIGTVEIIGDVRPETSLAKIINSMEAVKVGDELKIPQNQQ